MHASVDERPSEPGAPRSIAVAGLALASLMIYLWFSPVLRMQAEKWTYLQFVMRSLAETPNLRVFAFGFAPSIAALATFAVYVASCLAVGRLIRWAMHGRRAAVPMAWVGALAATVVPTLLIAMVRWPDGAGSITNGTICVAHVLLVAGVWWWAQAYRARTDAEVREEAPLEGTRERVSKRLQPLFVLAGLYALTILVSGFSGIFGYDSFSDHLAVPARWLLTGRLEHGLPEEIVTFYPGNFELLVRWTLSLGTDRLAFLLSFGSGVAAVWVVFRIALELGQSRTEAAVAALAAASMPVMAYQSIVVYSDTYTALCLLLATWLLIVFARSGAHKDPLISLGFGLALGLALGSKYSAGPPAVVLGSLWLLHAWRDSWEPVNAVDRLNWRRFGWQLVSMAVGVIPPMAYWYARNAVERGNPLYPLSVAGLPGINIVALLAGAPGPKSFLERLTWPWTEVGHGPGYETGLGPVFATLGVLAVIAFPFSRRRPQATAWLAWAILLLSAFAWWRTGVLVTRYGLFPLLLCFVFVGALWRSYRSPVVGATFTAIVTATMVSVGHEMLGGAAYNALFYDPIPPVPAVVDSLPPSRILNGVGVPSGYYARGRDQRHRVISPFLIISVDYVRGLKPDYLLLPEARESEFVAPLSLELMGRWTKDGQASVSLWRVPPGP